MTPSELWQTTAFRHPQSGRIYISCGAHEHGEHYRTYEVEGLDDVVTGEIEVEIDEALATRFVPRELEKPGIGRRESYRMKSFLTRKALPLDASFADWPSFEREKIQNSDGSQTAYFRSLYDGDYLYAGIEVHGDSSPARNANAQEVGNAYNGDCLEMFVAIDPGADPTRTALGENDFFFVIPAQRDVLNPRIHIQNKNRYVEGAASDLRVRKDGWDLALRIPWKSLGPYRPAPGDVLKWSFCVLYGDAAGSRAVNKLTWSGTGREWADVRQWGSGIIRFVD